MILRSCYRNSTKDELNIMDGGRNDQMSKLSTRSWMGKMFYLKELVFDSCQLACLVVVFGSGMRYYLRVWVG